MLPLPPAILALAAAPLVDLRGEPVPQLQIEQELDSLQAWLNEVGRAVELHVEWAETARLQRALLRRPFDLLHISGHGSRQDLAFEDGRGGLQPLSSGQLAALICPGGQLAFQLAFLSACHSEGLAAALLVAGVPHVIAIDASETVSDLAAAAFARAFYAALLAGQAVHAAFMQGQAAVRTDPDLYRSGQARGRPDLGERQARKFRLLPPGADNHRLPLFAASLPPGAAARRDPPMAAHRLSPRPGAWTGRQRELHALIGDVLDNRLTVLTGMGGMGKTTLAIEAARWLAGRGHFARLAWVDLRGIDSADLLRARLAAALACPPRQPAPMATWPPPWLPALRLAC